MSSPTQFMVSGCGAVKDDAGVDAPSVLTGLGKLPSSIRCIEFEDLLLSAATGLAGESFSKSSIVIKVEESGGASTMVPVLSCDVSQKMII